MSKLKFEMWRHEPKPGEFDGYKSRFTDGKGVWTESWWSAPPSSIDHVGPEYLKHSYRHPNVRTARHDSFIKQQYKVEIARLKALEVQP